MNDPQATGRKSDAYLRAVESHLGDRSPAVRRELLDELREHIDEGLRRHGGDIDRVLAEMDPPESFAEARGGDRPAAGPEAPSAAVPSGHANRWFLLALIFLLVNGYGVWKLTHGGPAAPRETVARTALEVAAFAPGENAVVADQTPLTWKFTRPVATTNVEARIEPGHPGAFVWASPTELRFEPAAPWKPCNRYRVVLDDRLADAAGTKLGGQREYHVQTAPLALVRVEQVNLTADREVSLRLVFNATPEGELLRKFLSLSEEDDPEIDYALLGAAGSNAVLIRTGPIDHDRFDLVLEPGLPAREGPLGLAEKVARSVPVVGEFRFIRLEAESPSFEACALQVIFSSKPDINGIASLISVHPPVKYTVEPMDWWRAGGLQLVGAFKPGGVYAVTLKAGMKSETGVALRDTVTRNVQFPGRPPSLTIATEGRYLSPRGSLQVPVSAVNVRECRVSLAPVHANNLVQLALRDANRLDGYYGRPEQNLIGRTVTQTNVIDGKPDQPARTAADLRRLAGGEPRGAYWLSVAGERTRGDRQLIVVTDLGIAARMARDGVLVWVNSLREATPVAGAEVTLYSDANQTMAHGRTGADGLAFLPLRPGDANGEPFVITAQAGNDLSYLDLERTRVAARGDTGGGAYLGAGDAEAFVFTERGVYRPGETAHMKALVRDAACNAPKPFPALFRIRKPDGRVFRDIPVTLDEFGAAEAAAELPGYLPTGGYSIELALPGTFTELGGTSVSLEDFVPPQIRVDLALPPGRLTGGQDVKLDVKSAHLFGRAAAGLKASAYFTFKAAPFAPAAWKGWSFGDPEKKFAAVYRQGGVEHLDDNGAAAFTCNSSAEWRPPAAIQVAQSATVFESGGRPVTAYGSSFLDVYPFYIGIRSHVAGTVRVGETGRVSVVEVTPDGSAATEAKPLKASLARVQWTSALARNSQGRYEWRSERTLTVVREDTVAAGGKPVDFAFVADASGEYLLTFADPASGASSSIAFHAAAPDQQWIEWSREKPDAIELALDRAAYRPGETAKLMIKAPFSGRALLTVETDRVLTRRLVVLEKNTAEIDIPVPASDAPNVFCCLTLIRPAVAESVWSAHRASGAIALKIDPSGHQLTVSLEAPPTNRPQARMTARINVRDARGQPATGAVTVMAVDEAICMLTAFETPDPGARFFEQRGLGIDLYDLYAELMPVIDDAVAGHSHTGGDEGAGLRRRLNPIKANRFKPVALWAAPVRLDTNGSAAVDFALPEFSGELRLMAVAYNERQTGSGDMRVKVKRDLVVQPALPRFLAPGDTCDATVELFNESGREIAATVRVTCGGPLTADRAVQTMPLKAGAQKTVRLPLRAGAAPGQAVCVIEVAGGGADYRETIELAVRPAAGLQVVSDAGALKAGERKEFAAPAGWVRESVAQDVWISREPSLKLARALDYVMRYPYGCLEQTVSGSLPLLHAADLAGRILPGSVASNDVAPLVQAGILRVLSMQQADGGFAMWPYQRDTWNAGTIYAAHFLAEAHKAAYPVPPDRLDAALGWLRERLDKSVPPIGDTGGDPDAEAVATEGAAVDRHTYWQADMQERAYACHVLALAGRPDHGWNARLREEAARLRFAAQVHVAAALLLSGEPRQATALLRQTGLPAARERETGGQLNSGVRDAALLLSAWLDIEPGNEAVQRLVELLDRKRTDDHWGTTQDNAMALLALGKYAQRVPADPRPFRGLLALPGLPSRAFGSTQDVHWAALPGRGGRITIVNDGPGTLYFSTRCEGVPFAEEIPEADAGLSVRRAFLDMSGAEIDATALPQGDLVVVKIVLDTKGRDLDNIAIEELIPAGWEIENPNLATSQQLEWVKEKSDWCIHRDIRDDRLLLFTGPVNGTQVFYYTARAVTPGRFILPPVTAACMYDPDIRSVSGRAKIEVTP